MNGKRLDTWGLSCGLGGIFATILAGCGPGGEDLATVQSALMAPLEVVAPGELPETPVAGARVYVPVYAKVYHDNGRAAIRLAVTLSVRNTDETRSIYIRRLDFFDTAGKRIRAYLERPARLGPLATAEFFVPEQDRSAGSGANFIVEWVADSAVSTPMLETVAIGTTGAQGISFVNPGEVIADLSSAANEP